MDNQYRQISGRAAVNDTTKNATLLASATDQVVRLISAHVVVQTASSGGTGIVTLRDGVAGTILAQISGATAGNAIDIEFHDGLGYPMTAGNVLSLEVSGATTQATVVGIATGYLVG
jgi:hypothetical protein